MNQNQRLACPPGAVRPDGAVAAPPGHRGSTATVEDAEWMHVWRPTGATGILVAQGRMKAYHVEPQGEYMITLLHGSCVDVTRGRTRHRMRSGQLGLWDPNHSHRGASSWGHPWEVQILVIELPSLAEVVADPERCPMDLEFPAPVLSDPSRAASFARLHRTLTGPASALEQQSSLASWLAELGQIGLVDARRREARRLARTDPALRRACELLRDDLAADLTLGDLAAAAGTSKYRLMRLFKTALGVPPHAYQVQVRIQRARALLEAGESPAEVAHRVGFYDQSHLNRHFRRTGVTPAGYAAAFRA